MKFPNNLSELTVVKEIYECPSCESSRVDIEFHDFTQNTKTFHDICFCMDCGEVFIVSVNRR